MESIEDIIGVFIPILGILSAVALPIFAIMYLGITYLKTRNKERLEAIKSGIPLPSSSDKKKADPNRLVGLRNGFLSIGLAVGIIAGLAYTKTMAVTTENGEYFFTIVASILLFLGIAYVAYYFVSKDKVDAYKNSDNE